MNRSYESAATANVIGTPYAGGVRGCPIYSVHLRRPSHVHGSAVGHGRSPWAIARLLNERLG